MVSLPTVITMAISKRWHITISIHFTLSCVKLDFFIAGLRWLSLMYLTDIYTYIY